nr:serine/threonine-protein kinase Nek11 isoform X3 [Pelodiscus sinensis]|eukprot:XP_006117646.1 serine/threonine-protein kinase Nek11 isoform X3 [Pelodiscus sinensis]
MLKFQEALKPVSGSTPMSTCSEILIARRYVLQQKLGRGSFGTVYLVSDKKAKQGEELKVLKEISVGDLKPNETVEANVEAQLLSKLDHPAIVKFYASFVERESFCIITEYCEGRDLDCKIQEYKKAGKIFTESQIIEWFIQLLLGVNYMHERRILHRDLKAKNIFLKNNLLKIGDFGVSRLLMGSCDLATTFTGTPYYMSPEALKHQGYDTKSDICMLNKNPCLRPSAAEILKISYIDEQLQKNVKCKFTNMAMKVKTFNCQKEAACIIKAVQKKVHLQTLRELSEVQKMTPRERMRLRKLNAADDKAKKLKELAEEKYQENLKRMQELRSRNFQQLSIDVLHESDEQTSKHLIQSQPVTAMDYISIGHKEPTENETPGRLCMSEPVEHEIPEDPQIAEEYYNDVFDSCSETSEEEGQDEEEEDNIEVLQTVSKTIQQDTDVEAMVRHLESVLNNSSVGSGTVTSVAPAVPQGSRAINNTMAETKLKRMRESAIQKLGAEVFEKVYNNLKKARQQNASEDEIRECLEKVVARASDCFEVDQLLYFEKQLLALDQDAPI